MKKVKYILLIFSAIQFLHSQSIVIGTGSSIYVISGADICATTYGNITGTMTGGGTQCSEFPLPVELTSFTAIENGKVITLNWKTETEVDNYGFDIERKINEKRWAKIGFVEGHGNSNSPKIYSFTDKNAIGGSKFKYRLKQIDTDGEFEYSDIVEVELIPNEFALFQNYPNPFNPATKIKYNIPELSFITLKVYDVLGNEIATLINEEKPIGNYEVEFYATSLPSGTYFYKLHSGSFVETKKMLLMK